MVSTVKLPISMKTCYENIIRDSYYSNQTARLEDVRTKHRLKLIMPPLTLQRHYLRKRIPGQSQIWVPPGSGWESRNTFSVYLRKITTRWHAQILLMSMISKKLDVSRSYPNQITKILHYQTTYWPFIFFICYHMRISIYIICYTYLNQILKIYILKLLRYQDKCLMYDD